MAVDHYENFPVASLLMPARLRPAVRAIYRFARTADDLADEGDALPAERLAALARLRSQLHEAAAGRPGPWPDLARCLAEHRLPIEPLLDLLSAFEQDVTVTRYPDEAALRDYCRRSANPVGRLMLHLFGRDQGELARQSDAICTGLQWTNFCQDVAVDWAKGRVYLPQADLRSHGLDERAIAAQGADPRWPALMRAQTARCRALLLDGAPLAAALGGRIGWELRLVVQGGLRILARIDRVGGDVFRRRPTLGPSDWATMALQALRG